MNFLLLLAERINHETILCTEEIYRRHCVMMVIFLYYDEYLRTMTHSRNASIIFEEEGVFNLLTVDLMSDMSSNVVTLTLWLIPKF